MLVPNFLRRLNPAFERHPRVQQSKVGAMLVEKFDRLRSVGGLVQSGTALVLVAELGPDFAERFSTARHFDLWLGLCPDNRITDGKIMSSATRDVKSRGATALRSSPAMKPAPRLL